MPDNLCGENNGQPAPAARRAEEETLLDTMAEGVYHIDAAGRVVFMNKAAREILGYAPEDILGRNSHKVFHHTKKDGTPNPVSSCPIGLTLKDGKTIRLQDELFWTKDGRPLPVDCTVAPFRENGEIRGLVISFRDITDRQNAQNDLKKEKEAAELVFQLVPSAIYIVDARKNIINWNKRAEEITGYGAAEVIGRPCTVFAEMPCRERCGLFDETVKKPIDCKECTIRAKDGRLLTVSKNADIIRNEKGEIAGGIESFEDITDRKLQESRQALAVEVLRCLADSDSRNDVIRNILLSVRRSTGIEAAGLRLRAGEDYPYYHQNGFPEDFILKENSLCAHLPGGEPAKDAAGKVLLECMCGNIICARTDPALPFFTKGGSFWRSAAGRYSTPRSWTLTLPRAG